MWPLDALSWLDLFWVVSTLGVGFTGIITFAAPHLSDFITDLFRYGVSASAKRSAFHRLIEVPKRWFTHFYIVAVASSTASAVVVTLSYVYGFGPPPELKSVLRRLSAPHSGASTREAGVLLAAWLLWVHACRRLLESVFTSVYSETRMNVLHYVLGLAHYAALPAALLAEAPHFTSRSASTARVAWELGPLQYAGVVLFVLASHQQHAVLDTLAAIRKSHTGNITNYAHAVLSGGWFDLVSCPHFLLEILIYVAFLLVLDVGHVGWAWVTLFVLTNRVLAALITHRWYRERFGPKYPPARKAILPFVL